MFGRRAAIAYGSVLAMCAAPVGAAERYADFRYTVEVTGTHATRNNAGDTTTINKNRRFDGRVRLRYLGPVAFTPAQPASTPRPTPNRAAGGADYIAKMMACQQKSANDSEAEACMIAVATAGPGGERAKRCLAKSEAERKKDPMCGGGGGAAEDSAPQPARQAPQGEVWGAAECEGNLTISDTGSQYAVADTTPGGGPITTATSTTGSWSGSSKRDPLAINNCSASVVIYPNGSVDVTLAAGPTMVPVISKFGSLASKSSINPFAWSSVQFNAGSLVVKNAARNGPTRQFSGNWSNSKGIPQELGDQKYTPNNRFSTTTSARWDFSAQ